MVINSRKEIIKKILLMALVFTWQIPLFLLFKFINIEDASFFLVVTLIGSWNIFLAMILFLIEGDEL
jgi:hypothetical protein